MAIPNMSAGDKDTVGPLGQGLEDEVGIYPSRAHDPDNPHFRRILHAAYSGQVRGRVCTPVAGKSNNMRTEVFGHILSSLMEFLKGSHVLIHNFKIILATL
jgi:hypothetical protein